MTSGKCQIVVCGRGGQGILFLTRVLDEAAVITGQNVISSETHGMAMRGGSVASFIRIGGFRSPLLRTGQADILLALAESEMPLYAHFVKRIDAQLYINSATKGKGRINADSIALKLGSLVLANLVLLGFASAHSDFPFSREIMLQVLNSIGSPQSRESNVRAFLEGNARLHI